MALLLLLLLLLVLMLVLMLVSLVSLLVQMSQLQLSSKGQSYPTTRAGLALPVRLRRMAAPLTNQASSALPTCRCHLRWCSLTNCPSRRRPCCRLGRYRRHQISTQQS